jgi:hypothetical protein
MSELQELIYIAHKAGDFEDKIQVCVHCGKVLADYTGSWYSDDGSIPKGWPPGEVISQNGNLTMVGVPLENFGGEDPYKRIVKYCTDK